MRMRSAAIALLIAGLATLPQIPTVHAQTADSILANKKAREKERRDYIPAKPRVGSDPISQTFKPNRYDVNSQLVCFRRVCRSNRVVFYPSLRCSRDERRAGKLCCDAKMYFTTERC